MARHIFVYLTYFLFLSASVLPETTNSPIVTLPEDVPEETSIFEALAYSAADQSLKEYYAFLEPFFGDPPKVRPPPYREEFTQCTLSFDVFASNLCGDLNKGGIPQNPMAQRPCGQSYPFELIRNHTLRFLPRTQPELSTNDTLPRVTYYIQRLTKQNHQLTGSLRSDAALALLGGRPRRNIRTVCDDGGILCTAQRFIDAYTGVFSSMNWRRDLGVTAAAAPDPPHTTPPEPFGGPLSPCSARVEYVTPLFVRNRQGAWRYVVQLPYEGYFTQTVEVSRCLFPYCQYTDGQCKSFPRWVSLLVAEIHYPPQDQNLQAEYQQSRQNGTAKPAAAEPSADQHTHCDGHDEKGCYQVKVYYDKFLVPGSCRCWRRGFLEEYRRTHQNDL